MRYRSVFPDRGCKHSTLARTALMLILACLLNTACTTVEPWQRGRLAQPQMALEADALLSAMNEHVYTSKEASSGAIGPAGGGCGCN